MAQEALCFDMYGTLCDTSSVTSRLGDVLDVANGLTRAIDELWRQKQLQYSYHRGQMEAYEPFWDVTDDALAYALAYYDISVPDADQKTILNAYNNLDPFPGAGECLQTLQAAGHDCVVLSNGNPDMLETLVDNAGLDAHLDGILSADAVGTFKPAPAVYEHAAGSLDRSIGECRLISSNAWDIVGASNAGMSTAWINRNREPAERLGETADIEITDLRELPAALNS